MYGGGINDSLMRRACGGADLRRRERRQASPSSMPGADIVTPGARRAGSA